MSILNSIFFIKHTCWSEFGNKQQDMKFVWVPTVFFLADGSSSGLDTLNTVTLLSKPLKYESLNLFLLIFQLYNTD